MNARIRAMAGMVVIALVGAACTEVGVSPTSTSGTAGRDSTTTSVADTTTTRPESFDVAALTWNRQVVLTNGSPLSHSWYTDISPHPLGFIAAGITQARVEERPAAWLSTNGAQWLEIEIPPTIEGHFTAVANDGEVSILVGYDTEDSSGLIVRIPRGAPPEEVAFTQNIAFTEVVATSSGFLAYGLADPGRLDPEHTLFTSTDGVEWRETDWLPLMNVFEAIVGPNGQILELEDPRDGEAVWMRDAGPPVEDTEALGIVQPLSLPSAEESGYPYAWTAFASDSGFLLGGGDLITGQPMMWEVQPVESGRPEVEIVEFQPPADSGLIGDPADIRHLSRSEFGWHAFVRSEQGRVEAWTSRDGREWSLDDVIGIHPSAEKYASAATITTNPPSPEPGPPRTLVVTAGSHPSEAWIVGEQLIDVSDFDATGFFVQPYPLLVGQDDESAYARLVEHAPRRSQTDPDIVRSRLFAFTGDLWLEMGATAWDRGSRIQSLVGLSGEVVALGTGHPPSGRSVSEVRPVGNGLLGEPAILGGDRASAQVFEAAANEEVAVVAAADPGSSGNRLSAWWSRDLESWNQVRLEETVNTFIGDVCSGAGRIWILGREGFPPFSSARSLSTVDGLTWAPTTPSVGDEGLTDLTACGGDDNQVVAGAEPGPTLVSTANGLIWERIEIPDEIAPADHIEEVAVMGDVIGIVVEHPAGYTQPRHSAWLFDGESWERLEPEPEADIASIALSPGHLYLGGASTDGAILWDTPLAPQS